MAVNNQAVVDWFRNRQGRLTYSMTGSRNGTDGTADCSGSIVQAIKDAGGVNYSWLYTTVYMYQYLEANGYSLISRNQEWNAQMGDIVLMSWGSDMASSGGAGGHVGVMTNANDFISTDYWTGGQAGTAVSEHNFDTYYNVNAPRYFEVWRLQGGNQAPQPQQDTNNMSALDKFRYVYGNEFAFVNPIHADRVEWQFGMWQAVSYDLAAGGANGWDWFNNGIPLAMIDNVNGTNNVVTGDNFTIMKGYDRGTIDFYSPQDNAVGILMGEFGLIWFDADALMYRY